MITDEYKYIYEVSESTKLNSAKKSLGPYNNQGIVRDDMIYMIIIYSNMGRATAYERLYIGW